MAMTMALILNRSTRLSYQTFGLQGYAVTVSNVFEFQEQFILCATVHFKSNVNEQILMLVIKPSIYIYGQKTYCEILIFQICIAL